MFLISTYPSVKEIENVRDTRLDQINAHANHDKSISRHRLFYLKGIEWFGLVNIEVYKRFIGNNIFM